MKGFTTVKLAAYSFCFFVLCLLLASCHTQRIGYFKDIPDTTTSRFYRLSQFTSPVIHPDDILNIVIQTLDPTANQVLNQGNLPVLSGSASGVAAGGATQSVVSGYLVDKDGFIRMPYIGNVSVKGLTTVQVRDTIVQKISLYFKDPVVNVRFANFKVTVLGEVRTPSTFVIPNEKPTVIDALGLAGDITIYGKRENVLLIRDVEGRKEVTRLNLDSSKSISSPYFYLKPNDVLYVEPTASRVESTDAYRTRNISIISAAISVVAIIISRLIK
jgi:polysaccharide export outer membrane protein